MRINGNSLGFSNGFFRNRSSMFSKLFGSNTARSGTTGGPARSAAHGKGKSTSALVEAAAKKQSEQSAVKSPGRESYEKMKSVGFRDWGNAALYNKKGLVAQLFGGPRASKVSGAMFNSRGNSTVSKLRGTKDAPRGTEMKPQSEQWAVRSSARDVLDQMNRGSYLYKADGGNFYVQGRRDNGEPDEKKYCSLKDIREAFDYDNPKTMSVKDNTVTFEKDSIYSFNGSDGKEHTVMSHGGILEADHLSRGRGQRDQEAERFARFWSDLANGDEKDLSRRYSREEIRSRLKDAGVKNGSFTVKAGGRSEIYYLSKEEDEAPLLTRKAYGGRRATNSLR